MSKFLEEYRKRQYAEELAAQAEKDKILQENINEYRESLKPKGPSSFSVIADTHFQVFKAVLCECVGNLYLDSLVIDDPYKYSKVLKESADEEVLNAISDCKCPKDVFAKLENAGSYIQSAMILAESIASETAEEIANGRKDKSDDEFDREKLLSPEAKKQIDAFEAIEGKADVSDEIQQRVIDTYKKEEDIAKEKQERTQNLIDKLVDKDGGSLNESTINSGISTFGNLGNKTIFQSIFHNRSRQVIQESGTLVNNNEQVLAESICMYTLLECIHSLGIKPLNVLEKRDLISKMSYGK